MVVFVLKRFRNLHFHMDMSNGGEGFLEDLRAGEKQTFNENE